MMEKCINGRILLVTDVECLEERLGFGWVPYVVLITAYSKPLDGGVMLCKLVNMLLEKGARSFVCTGPFSEALHDEIDKVIYKRCEDFHAEEELEVTTTYHDDEPVDDVVSYFVYGTSIPGTKSGGLLAIMGEGGQEVRECLNKYVAEDGLK
ncbi:hypothetical protein LJR232_005905 [Aquipseudomonas alcaligenes]